MRDREERLAIGSDEQCAVRTTGRGKEDGSQSLARSWTSGGESSPSLPGDLAAFAPLLAIGPQGARKKPLWSRSHTCNVSTSVQVYYIYTRETRAATASSVCSKSPIDISRLPIGEPNRASIPAGTPPVRKINERTDRGGGHLSPSFSRSFAFFSRLVLDRKILPS